jgi:glycosyltransferase involved in cell wall biosynthesis
MMHLFLNGLAASAGGGLTYLRNVLPHLSTRQGVRVTAAVSPQLRRELGVLPQVSFPEINLPAGALQRFWQEQTTLATAIRQSGADVLFSVGNFALRKSPVPQVLLSRNSLYTSAAVRRDVRRRGEHGLWLETRIKGSLARRSIAWADLTVAPTEAFAQELRQWTGRHVVAIHHGFDPEAFSRDETPLAENIRQKLEPDQDALRLLYVSHYNYYRNFETLLRALPVLRERLGGRKLRLFLTCRLRSEDNPGSYRAQAAADLVARLGVADIVVELGAVPYSRLHRVYRECNIYVAPAYAESFAHPLVEAMASGLPVVAADTAVHREICQDAALYFPRFSPEALGARVCQIADSAELSQALADRGRERSRAFSWHKHVDELLNLAANLLATIDPVRRRSGRAS